MKSLKQLKTMIKPRKAPIVGFASIHKNDDSDKLLPKAIKTIIGFASIHKNDDSDKQLKEEKELEDEKSELGSQNPYVAKVKDKVINYDANRGPENPDLDTDEDTKHLKHHLDLNKKHVSKHGKMKAPLQLYTYTSSGLNKHLIRKFKGEKLKDNTVDDKTYGDRDKVIHKELIKKEGNLKHSLVVHSGVGEEMAKHLMSSRKGDIVHTPAYTSTSVDPHIAHNFVHNTANAHIMHFHLPKGHVGSRYVENITAASGEHEVVLNRGTNWKKVGYHKSEYKRDLHSKFTVHNHHFVPVGK